MAGFDLMSLGGALPSAMQGFMQGMDLRQQRDDRKNQKKVNDIMGQMLMGTASQEQEQFLAQNNPQAYSGFQQQRQAQAQQQQAQQQQQVMQQEIMSAINSGDRNIIAQVITKYPQAEKAISAAVATKFPEGKFQQATAKGMDGYVFNQSTGEFSVSEDIRKNILANASKPELTAKDVQSLDKDFRSMSDSANSIYTAAKDLEALENLGGGAAALGLVFKFMNVLDPGVSVQEGDVANAKNAGGVPAKILNMYNNLAQGGEMDAKTAREFIKVAKTLSNNAVDAANKTFDTSLVLYGDTLTPEFKTNLKTKLPSKFELTGDKVVDTAIEDFQPFGATDTAKPSSIKWSDM